MKKILTVLAISFSALMASSLSTAAPQFDHDHPRYGNEPRGRDFRDSGNDEQWYKINNDYILVDADSNNILRIMGL